MGILTLARHLFSRRGIQDSETETVTMRTIVETLLADPRLVSEERWKAFAAALGISSSNLEQLEETIPSDNRSKLYLILEAWKSATGRNATTDCLKKVLLHMGMYKHHAYLHKYKSGTEVVFDQCEIIPLSKPNSQDYRLRTRKSIRNPTTVFKPGTTEHADIFIENLQENPFLSDFNTATHIINYYAGDVVDVVSAERIDRLLTISKNSKFYRVLKITITQNFQTHAYPLSVLDLANEIKNKMETDYLFSEHGFVVYTN